MTVLCHRMIQITVGNDIPGIAHSLNFILSGYLFVCLSFFFSPTVKVFRSGSYANSTLMKPSDNFKNPECFHFRSITKQPDPNYQ